MTNIFQGKIAANTQHKKSMVETLFMTLKESLVLFHDKCYSQVDGGGYAPTPSFPQHQ